MSVGKKIGGSFAQAFLLLTCFHTAGTHLQATLLAPTQAAFMRVGEQMGASNVLLNHGLGSSNSSYLPTDVKALP